MNKTHTPSRSKFAVLRQICNLIPSHLVPKLARETGVDKKARTFSPWSHLVSLIYAHLTHAIGLNDVCDALGLHSGLLVTLRAATPPIGQENHLHFGAVDFHQGSDAAHDVGIIGAIATTHACLLWYYRETGDAGSVDLPWTTLPDNIRDSQRWLYEELLRTGTDFWFLG